MNASPHLPGRSERALDAALLTAFRLALVCMVAGLTWTLSAPADVRGAYVLTAGLLALMATPALRLLSILAAATRDRDWVTFGATVAVIVILVALTLRDAAAP